MSMRGPCAGAGGGAHREVLGGTLARLVIALYADSGEVSHHLPRLLVTPPNGNLRNMAAVGLRARIQLLVLSRDLYRGGGGTGGGAGLGTVLRSWHALLWVQFSGRTRQCCSAQPWCMDRILDVW